MAQSRSRLPVASVPPADNRRLAGRHRGDGGNPDPAGGECQVEFGNTRASIRTHADGFSILKSPGHPFYGRLNEVLKAAGFDWFVEKKCARFGAARGACLGFVGGGALASGAFCAGWG